MTDETRMAIAGITYMVVVALAIFIIETARAVREHQRRARIEQAHARLNRKVNLR